MVEYVSCGIYLESSTSLKDRITKTLQVINALENQRLSAALDGSKSNIKEYSLDDGQTKIKTVYRDLVEINNAIIALEKELERMYNKLNGRMVRLTDGKNFKGYRFNGR